MIATIERITPQQAKDDLRSGALLVCAYDSEDKFRMNHLQGAIALADLRPLESYLPKDRELIFYCA